MTSNRSTALWHTGIGVRMRDRMTWDKPMQKTFEHEDQEQDQCPHLSIRTGQAGETHPLTAIPGSTTTYKHDRNLTRPKKKLKPSI